MTSRRIYLVTGGGGFIGSHIIRALREHEPECAVRAFQRSPQPELVAEGVEVIRGDLQDPGALSRACEGVDAVFHVAARAGIWGSWDSFYEPNVIGTRNVIYGCKSALVPYLIYTSTPSVVFSEEPIRGGNEQLPYPESWPFHYGHTKALAESSVLDIHNESEQGIRTVALRPHLVWGPGDPHIAPRLIQRTRQGRLRIVGDGTNRVDVSHVKNVARAHVLALEALRAGRAGGKAYFISDGEPVVLWDWINTLLEGVGLPPLKKRIGYRAAHRLGASLEWAFKTFNLKGEPPMTRFVASNLAKDHWFDISAARKDLGYEPEYHSGNAMEDLLLWCREQGF